MFGVVNSVFWVNEDAFDEWARCMNDGNVLLYDTSHGMLICGMKVGCFCTVGESGQTVVLAVSLVLEESAPLFKWAFEQFANAFREAPSTIFTDGDGAMAAAIEKLTAEGEPWSFCNATEAPTVHLLCTFHLSKNLYTHIRPLLTLPKWQQFHGTWWNMIKYTDFTKSTSAHEEIDPEQIWKDEWEELTEIVVEHGSGATKEQQLEWLADLGEKKEKYAARWTWHHRTYGVHSTQRSESVHASVKTGTHATMRFAQLVEYLVEFNRRARDRKATDGVRKALQQQGRRTELPPMVLSLKDKVTPYAFEHLIAQSKMGCSGKYKPPTRFRQGMGVYCGFDRTHGYRVTPVEDPAPKVQKAAFDPSTGAISYEGCVEEDFGLSPDEPAQGRQVELRIDEQGEDHLVYCSCMYYVMMGLPCRHMICVGVMTERHHTRTFPIELIADKWVKRTETQQAVLTSAMLTSSVPKPIRLNINDDDPKPRTKDERRSLLWAEFRALANLGSESDVNMEKVRAGMKAILAEIQADAKAIREAKKALTGPSEPAAPKALAAFAAGADAASSSGASSSVMMVAAPPSKYEKGGKPMSKSAGKKKVAPAVVHDGSAPIPVEQLRPPPAAGGGKVPKRRQPAAGPGNAEYQKAARRRERGVGGGGIRE